MIRFNLTNRALILVTLPFLVELLFIVSLINLLNSVGPSVQQEMTANDVVDRLNKLMWLTQDSTASAMLFFVTKSTTVLQHQQKAKDELSKAFGELENYIYEELKSLEHQQESKDTKSNAFFELGRFIKEQQESLSEVELLKTQLKGWVSGQTNLVKGESSPNITGLYRSPSGSGWSEIFSDMRKWPVQFLLTGDRHLIHDGAVAREEFKAKVRNLLLTALVSNVVVALLLALFYSLSVTKRVKKVTQNASRLTAGEPLGACLTGSDEISAVDAALHDLSRSRVELERFEKDLTNIVNCELKVPLTSLQGILFLLTQDGAVLDEKTQKSIYRAEQNISWLIKLVNDLLDLEKTRAAKYPLLLSVFSLKKLVETACDAVQPLAKKENVVVDLYGIDGPAFGDFERLLKVATNLLSAAIRASALGGKIVVDYESMPEGALIKITDSGTGIPENLKGKIFEQFQIQPDRLLSEEVPSGLELPLCHAIVSQHGGEIVVESLARRGCTYTVKIPKAQEIVQAPHISLAPEQIRAGETVL